jgi:hypothetical protein
MHGLKNVGAVVGVVLALSSAGVYAGEVDCSGSVKISFPTFDSSCGDGRDCRVGGPSDQLLRHA